MLGSGFEIESNPRSSRRYCRRLRENKENSSQDRSLRTSPLSRASRDAAAIALQCRHDWRKYPARVSHPSRRMRQRFKLRSTSSSFSPVEIKAKIGDRNIRNTLLAGAACLLSLALGGVLEPLFKKYPNHPGYSWSRTSRVANFATESNRSATPNSIHPQQLGLELFDITVRHKRRNPEEQYGRPFHAPR